MSLAFELMHSDQVSSWLSARWQTSCLLVYTCPSEDRLAEPPRSYQFSEMECALRIGID